MIRINLRENIDQLHRPYHIKKTQKNYKKISLVRYSTMKNVILAGLSVFELKWKRTRRYQRLEDCPNAHIEENEPDSGKVGYSLAKLRDQVPGTDNGSETVSCHRWTVRRHGVCEIEIKEDVETLRRQLVDEAMRSASFF